MKYSKNIFHLHCVQQIIIFLLISLTSTLRVKPRLAKLNSNSNGNGYPAASEESQSLAGNNQSLFEALPLQFLTEHDRQSAEADLSFKLPVPNSNKRDAQEQREIIDEDIYNSTIKYSNESQIDSAGFQDQVIESREGPAGQNHLPFALPFIGELSHNNGRPGRPDYDYIPQHYIVGHNHNQNQHFDHQAQYESSYEKSSISPTPDATEEIHLTSDLDDVQNIHLHLYLDGPESGGIETIQDNQNSNSNQNNYKTEPNQISENVHYQVNRIDYAGHDISPTAGSIENPDRGYKYKYRKPRPSTSYGNQGSAGSHLSFKIPSDLLCLKGLSAGFATFKTIFLAVKGAIGFKGLLFLLTPLFIVLAPILLFPLLILLLFLPIPVLTPTTQTSTTTQRYDNGGGGYGSGNNGGGYGGGGGNGEFNMSYGGGGGGYGSTTRRTTTTTTPSTPTTPDTTTMLPTVPPTLLPMPSGFGTATATVPNFPLQNNNMMMMMPTPSPSLLPGITGIGQQFNPGGNQLFPGTGGQLPGGQILPNLQQPGMQPGLPSGPAQTLPIGISSPQQQMMMLMPMTMTTMTRPSPGGTSVMPTTPTRTTTSEDEDTRIQSSNSHKHHFFNLNKNNYNLNQFPLMQATELSKIILQSEDCLERIMCELESSNNFRKDYGYMVDKEQEAAEERVEKWIKTTLRDTIKYDQVKNKFGTSFAERRDCNDFFCRRISYIKRVFNWF